MKRFDYNNILAGDYTTDANGRREIKRRTTQKIDMFLQGTTIYDEVGVYVADVHEFTDEEKNNMLSPE